MAEFKGFDPLIDERSIRHMLRVLDDRFMIAVAQDREGRIIAARGAGRLGSHGQDLFAATPEEGRRCYASYVTLWCLLEELRDIGVKTYDFGGIDPENNPGVYNFKRGAGGVKVRRLGEWDWSNSPILARAVNAWVRARGMAVT
jgi:lipid II:glycine glycyltransferase (peptidoglycan interpeptide bridge formation enzyme)